MRKDELYETLMLRVRVPIPFYEAVEFVQLGRMTAAEKSWTWQCRLNGNPEFMMLHEDMLVRCCRPYWLQSDAQLWSKFGNVIRTALLEYRADVGVVFEPVMKRIRRNGNRWSADKHQQLKFLEEWKRN